MLKKNCTIGIWWLPKWNSISFFPFPFEFPFCHRTCPFKAGSYRVTLLFYNYTLNERLPEDLSSWPTKIFPDLQFQALTSRWMWWTCTTSPDTVQLAFGSVDTRATPSTMWINHFRSSILHNTFNVEKPQWPTNAQMFSWNMSGNPMEQYFTEWESGYPKNRCKNFFLFSTCFFYLNLHRTCELWVLQCSR